MGSCVEYSTFFRVKSPNSHLQKQSLLANYPDLAPLWYKRVVYIYIYNNTLVGEFLWMCVFSVSIWKNHGWPQLHNSQASTGHRRHVDQLTREGIHLRNGARRTKETSGAPGDVGAVGNFRSSLKFPKGKKFNILPPTLPETNIANENRPSQKETSIPTIHFQVLVSGRVYIWLI